MFEYLSKRVIIVLCQNSLMVCLVDYFFPRKKLASTTKIKQIAKGILYHLALCTFDEILNYNNHNNAREQCKRKKIRESELDKRIKNSCHLRYQIYRDISVTASGGARIERNSKVKVFIIMHICI